MSARRPKQLSCPLLYQTHAVKQEGVLRQRSAQFGDCGSQNILSAGLLMKSSSDHLPVGGPHCVRRFTSAGGSSMDYPIQHMLSNGQADHQIQRQAQKENDKNMRVVLTDRSAAKAEVQNLFFALEQHKREQCLALQAAKHEILTRIDDLEDRLLPVQRSVQAIQNRCDDQQEQLNHILESAKEELTQVKQDILSKLECSVPSKSPPVANQVSMVELVPHIPASADDGLVRFSENSHATDTNMSTEFKVAAQSIFPVIIEENEFDLGEKIPALPTESGAVTIGARHVLSSLCMVGKPPEQKVGPPLKSGKALKYIMENYSRLERAALGIDQSNSGCSPLEPGK